MKNPNSIRLEQEQFLERRVGTGGNRMKRRSDLRGRLFGKQFDFTMPAAFSRIDGAHVSFVIADARPHAQSFGRAEFDFNGGPNTPRAEIELTAIRRAVVTLDGRDVVLAGAEVTPQGIVAQIPWVAPLPTVQMVCSVKYQIYQFTCLVDGSFSIAGFAVLSLTVNS